MVKGDLLFELNTPNDDIMAVEFSPDGQLLFYGSTDCTIGVVDVSTRKQIAVLSGHTGGVNALAFSPDGKLLTSAGGDGLVRFWPWRQLLGREEKEALISTPQVPSRSDAQAKGRGRGKRTKKE